MARAPMEWDERRGAQANARRVLPEFVAAYFQKVRQFLEKDREPKDFHRMRLASKRLRYTLELFVPCYGIGLEERLETLKELQDSLGEVNDAVASRALLGHKVSGKAREFLKNRAAQ